MSPETIVPSLENRFEQKEQRLSKSIRTHIRKLKQEGKLKEAIQFRNDSLQSRDNRIKSKEEKAKEKLDVVVNDIITTENKKIEAERQVKALWLMQATGEITPEERYEELTELINSVDESTQAYLDQRLPDIRDEVEHLLPKN